MILTSHSSIGRCREAFLLGAADFLEKPVGRASLLATLDQAYTDAVAPLIDSTAPDVLLDLPYDETGAALVRRGIQIIERRFPEHDLTIACVAKEAGASPEHFSRQFRARIGSSAVEHLHKARISHAERLLFNSNVSIYEIACECGYKRNSEFSSWYRRLRGSTPSRLRRAK